MIVPIASLDLPEIIGPGHISEVAPESDGQLSSNTNRRYDLERGVLLRLGEDRMEEILVRFFAPLSRGRSATIQVVCPDMWKPYLKAVREDARKAQILFDQFRLVQHLNRAVDEVRRSEMRRLSGQQKASFKRTRFLLLKNPWKLTPTERERLSTPGALEHPDRARLLPQGSLSALLELSPFRISPRASPSLDALGDAFPTPILQGFRSSAACSSRWGLGLDPAVSLQRCAGRHEQQDQTGQPPGVRIPLGRELHRGDLSLLCSSAPAGRGLIALLGDEPHFLFESCRSCAFPRFPPHRGRHMPRKVT